MYPGGRLSIAVILLGLSGCGRKNPESPPSPPSPPPSAASSASKDHGEKLPEAERLQHELADTRRRLDAAREEGSKLQAALEARGNELTTLEEANASLELELASALEELLRSQASVRSVQSRAFAVSRISEVRVELESFQDNRDPALRARLDRADEFLTRADRALDDDNIGGAAYLAERAGELLRQARSFEEAREKAPREVIPIIPPRTMEVQVAANLRREPSVNSDRVGGVQPGTSVKAVARRGDWYQIVTESGTKAWIHRGLVR